MRCPRLSPCPRTRFEAPAPGASCVNPITGVREAVVSGDTDDVTLPRRKC
jgi:hypothetical protein